MTTQTHLNKKESINLGSFYTPNAFVHIVYEKIKPYINPKEYTLLDSSCGYGNFLHLQSFKDIIGIDIDEKALQKAKEVFAHSINKPLFLHKNALHNVSRAHFNITETDKLIIVGNPPYNDKTSIVQSHLKDKQSIMIDSNLKARDIGMSFLKSYAMLKADYICILHPLSYLIKKTNFNALKAFSNNYRLIDSTIISSKEFCKDSKGYFPIIIGLYKRDNKGMDYDFIYNFTFTTIEHKSFRLNDFDFIARYIDKYPNKKKIQEYVAMFYTLRDINALARSKTFMQKANANTIYVSKEKYSLYCYIDVFKMQLEHIPYYFGNCDILIDYDKFKALESHFVKASEKRMLSLEIENYFKELLGVHYED